VFQILTKVPPAKMSNDWLSHIVFVRFVGQSYFEVEAK
jgi:hypothetical protein